MHCYSQKPRAKTVTTAAAGAFESLARASGIVVDEMTWQEQLSSEPAPTVPEFVKFWTGVFQEQAVKAEMQERLLSQLPLLVASHPALGEEVEVVKREGVVYIEDVDAFKATLTPSDEPRPLVDWNDLPISKF